MLPGPYRTIHLRIFATILIIAFLQTCVSPQKCLNIIEKVRPKKVSNNNQVVDITMATTKRISHQVATHTFKILLEEFLGFTNVSIVYIEDHLSLIEGLPRGENMEPAWHINLEVWMSNSPNKEETPIQLKNYYMKDVGNIAAFGKIGWFVPRQTIKNNNSSLFWDILKQPDELIDYDLTSDPSIFDYVKSNAIKYEMGSLGIYNGMYEPNYCMKSRCATLLAPNYNDTSFVLQQIKEYNLYVRVIWLGENLRQVSQKLIQKNSKQSFMILSWIPSHVIHPSDEFITITFPCDTNLNIGCRYEKHRLVKTMWIQLDSEHAIEKLANIFFLNGPSYNFIYEQYYNKSEKNTVETMYSIACEWIHASSFVENLKNKSVLTANKELVYIGGIFPIRGNSSLTASATGIIRAAQLAVDEINHLQLFGSDLELRLIAHDGRCEANFVMREFITMTHYANLLGILGPACSETIEPLAGITKLYNVVTISYSAEGVSFSDRQKYPFFFRTIGENLHYIPVYEEFFKRMQWLNIAALTEDGHKSTEYLSRMNLKENKKFPTERKADELKESLQDLKRQRARIIIVDVDDDLARSIMCEAYHLNMTANHGYVWFLPSWFSDNWYNTSFYNVRKNETVVRCPTQEMVKSINGYFTLSHAFFAPNTSHMTMSNRTVGAWRSNYTKECTEPHCTLSNYAGYAYDAVWTYAYALVKLQNYSSDSIDTLRMDNTSRKFVNYIKETDFDGASGHISFGNGASRKSVIEIRQWINGTKNLVGTFDPHFNETTHRPSSEQFKLNNSNINWLGGKRPTDGSEIECHMFEWFAKFLDVQCETALLVVNIVGFTLLSMLLAVTIYVFKRKYEQKMFQHQEMMRTKFGLELDDTDFGEKWEIAREHVVINRKLGQGAFGTVYGGEAYLNEKGWVGVAVKTLKLGAKVNAKLDFLSEAEVMKLLDHKNIVKLIAVCTKSEPVYTIMEYMLYGDLKTYLLARRHLVNERAFEENDEISSKKLTSMALDVARALSYLASEKFVHRDIACRNCLVNHQRMVKIGDFGLTRRLHESDYYKFRRRGYVPIRWMAPESLSMGVYTPSTDIWSYGILLYEIITFGNRPYQEYSDPEVLNYVKEGKVLKIPNGAKPQLEGLIKSCWNLDPKSRPQASQIVEFLASSPKLLTPCLDGPKQSIDISQNSNDLDDLPDTVRKCAVNGFPSLPPINPLSFITSESQLRPRLVRQDSTASELQDEDLFEGVAVPPDHSYVQEPLLRNGDPYQKIVIQNTRPFTRQGSTVSDYRVSDSSQYVGFEDSLL